ncbi:hypothetical protein L227DRAFT_577374 [Lentinus tigrinus ALCF2SS1-6]|uniref:Uncharacterized protein n=1 Tax=Lentinus tigrinus ALCF2SS1-6 TaxID=1328759 RepID=A0A5C2S3G0_9APHY|nr:hypothetical protein L227DRAFT_577374 [Lentinus tigrinus ALCF2SS1-6]
MPMIPLHGGLRDSALSLIPLSSSTTEATPLPRGSREVHKAEMLSGPPSGTSTSDHFSLRTRRSLVSASTAPTPDDFSGWGGKPAALSTPAPETPSTPSVGSLMGRLKAFSKSTP